MAQANSEQVLGPGPVAFSLEVNGEQKSFLLEPRTVVQLVAAGMLGLERELIAVRMGDTGLPSAG